MGRAVLVILLALVVSLASCGGDQSDDNSDNRSNEIKQTLGLIGNLVETCDLMLGKLSERQETYASMGNVRGEQLMGEAAGNVNDMRSTALAIEKDIASPETTDGTSGVQDVQAKVQEIEEAERRLEENLEEAIICCGLSPDFLDEERDRLRAQTDDLQEQIEQIDPGSNTQDQYN